METTNSNQQHRDAGGWMKALGLAGFYFFLIKGLIWLAASVLLYRFF